MEDFNPIKLKQSQFIKWTEGQSTTDLWEFLDHIQSRPEPFNYHTAKALKARRILIRQELRRREQLEPPAEMVAEHLEE